MQYLLKVWSSKGIYGLLMSNALYTTFKTALLNGAVNMSTANIYVALVSAAYTPNLATDQYLSTVASAIVARSAAALSGATVSAGAFSSGSLTFTNVSGSTVTQAVLYVNSGSDATSQLILVDTSATSGLPVTPNGGNITISWSPNIFTL